ncbi:MAG: rRNA maturation RNase YbeY [Sphingomonas sp.]|nr:rRNA maturation RNase YbeY [Sphingomonas sp.]
MLDVTIEADPEWDSRTDWQQLVRAAAAAAIAESRFPRIADNARSAELFVRLTGDQQVQALNAQWRGKDGPTNVLSFPLAEAAELETADGPGLLLGDVVLAGGICQAEAREKSLPLESHATHLVVHGTLHLLGHDHSDDVSADDMEQREIRALARLGIANPYAPVEHEAV